MAQNLLKWINFRKTRDAARNRGSILIGMIFLEMAYLQLYADSRCFSLPCLLLCQFEKTFTPLNRKFQGEMDQNCRKIGSDSNQGSKRTLVDITCIIFSIIKGRIGVEACVELIFYDVSPFMWTTKAQIKPTTAPLRGAVVGFIHIFVYRVSKFLSARRGLKLWEIIADIQFQLVLKFELSSSYRK